MTVGEIYDKSLREYRQRYAEYVGLALPIRLIIAFILWLPLHFSPPIDSAAYGGVLIATVLPISTISSVMAYPLVVSPLISHFFHGYLDLNPRYSKSIMRVLRLVFPLLGASIFWIVLTGLGVAFAFFPALLIYVRYSLTPHAIVIEGEGGYGAIKRAKTILEGKFQPSAVRLLIPVLAELMLSQLLTALILLLRGSEGFGRGPEFLVFGFLIPLLFDPLRALLSSYLYLDVREEREGLTIDVLRDEFLELDRV